MPTTKTKAKSTRSPRSTGTSITLDASTLKGVDARCGPRGRSAWINQACIERIEREPKPTRRKVSSNGKGKGKTRAPAKRATAKRS